MLPWLRSIDEGSKRYEKTFVVTIIIDIAVISILLLLLLLLLLVWHPTINNIICTRDPVRSCSHIRNHLIDDNLSSYSTTMIHKTVHNCIHLESVIHIQANLLSSHTYTISNYAIDCSVEKGITTSVIKRIRDYQKDSYFAIFTVCEIFICVPTNNGLIKVSSFARANHTYDNEEWH